MDSKNVISFPVSDYFLKTYGFDPEVHVELDKPADLPYSGFVIARANATGQGEMKSYLTRDTGIPFDETLANKIINDPKVKVECLSHETTDYTVTDYMVVCENRKAIMFQPTATELIMDCLNSEMGLTVEVRFVFDSMYILSVPIHYEIYGPCGNSLFEAVEDIKNSLKGDAESIRAFFNCCDNVERCTKNENGEAVLELVLSGFDGEVVPYSLVLDKETIRDIHRAVVCIRAISCDNDILKFGE